MTSRRRAAACRGVSSRRTWLRQVEPDELLQQHWKGLSRQRLTPVNRRVTNTPRFNLWWPQSLEAMDRLSETNGQPSAFLPHQLQHVVIHRPTHRQTSQKRNPFLFQQRPNTRALAAARGKRQRARIPVSDPAQCVRAKHDLGSLYGDDCPPANSPLTPFREAR